VAGVKAVVVEMNIRLLHTDVPTDEDIANAVRTILRWTVGLYEDCQGSGREGPGDFERRGGLCLLEPCRHADHFADARCDGRVEHDPYRQ
jgi:hypothetical protein